LTKLRPSRIWRQDQADVHQTGTRWRTRDVPEVLRKTAVEARSTNLPAALLRLSYTPTRPADLSHKEPALHVREGGQVPPVRLRSRAFMPAGRRSYRRRSQQ